MKLCGWQPPNLETNTMTEQTTNTEQNSVAADCPSERLVMWRCDGCGHELSDDEVEQYGGSHCHVVAVADAYGNPEPAPCGPVNRVST